VQLAKFLGLAPSIISRAEHDIGSLDLPVVQTIEERFGVAMRWVVTGKGGMFLDKPPGRIAIGTCENKDKAAATAKLIELVQANLDIAGLLHASVRQLLEVQRGEHSQGRRERTKEAKGKAPREMVRDDATQRSKEV
jgi:transcriptional regulator with XRE-family HTH domain